MSTKAIRHTHKYHRVSMGTVKVWACALDKCNHYMPKHMENMVPGKATICWRCGEETQLDPALNMNMERPVCIDCNPDGFKTGTSISDMNVPEPKTAEQIIEENTPITLSITEIMQKMAADEAKKKRGE
jgi:hypothetical protein